MVFKIKDISMQQVAAMQVATTIATSTITNSVTMSMKHSTPFHISPASLFRNKRLKQKRLKREAVIKNSYLSSYGSQKTDSQPAYTINLLSDDEDENQQQEQGMFNGIFPRIQQQAQILIMPQQMQSQQQQQQYNYQRPISNSEPPPLVPLASSTYSSQQHLYYQKQQQDKNDIYHNLGIMSMQTLSMAGLSEMPILSKKRKRKTNKKKSLPVVIMNSESIVLSDDSDQDCSTQPTFDKRNNGSSTNNNNIIPILPELTLTAINHSNNHNINHQQQQQPLHNQSGGEEEVTVSLVPRCNNSGNLGSTSLVAGQSILNNAQKAHHQEQIVGKNIEIFPMLPDETIVHTVIANRTYELSLTKLREGLAHSEQTAPVTKVHSPHTNTTTASLTSMPPTPISLKLSSDLSISLISDDEDDYNQADKNEQALLSAEKLRREQPQLSVQQVSGAASPSSKQPQTKRRKLG